MELPHGHSLIVQSFRKPFAHEHSKSKFILTDPLGNKWSSPEVFNQWRECVRQGELSDIDLTKYQVAIVRFGNEFKLATSNRKDNYKIQIFPISSLPDPLFPNADEEDPREKKDPDYVPPNDSDDELD